MFRQLLVLGLAFCLFAPFDSVPILEARTDAAGVEWIGPIRKCPIGSDRELDLCLTKIVQDLTPLVGAGIEELGLEPLNPIFIEKFLYEQKLGPINFSVGAKNIHIYNLPKYKTLKFHIDTTKSIVRFIYEVPNLKVDADYNLGGNVFFFPLKGRGPAHIELHGMKVQGHMDFFKTQNENGESVIQLKDTIIDSMTIKDMGVRIQGLFDGNPLFGAVSNYIGNHYGPQIFEVIRPEVAKLTGEIITTRLLNPIFNMLPYVAEYFPDV